jgi:hypothetical protein
MMAPETIRSMVLQTPKFLEAHNLRQVGGFLHVLCFPTPIKLTAMVVVNLTTI